MKSLFSSRISKFNVLMTLCSLSAATVSIPAMAAAKEVCVETSTGEVVCGKPVQLNPSQNNDETIQIQSWFSSTWELKSCLRKNQVITCTISMSVPSDGHWDLPVNRTRITDQEGNQYRAVRYQVGKGIAGENGVIGWNIVQNIKYRIIITFTNVPTSVRSISLLEIVGTGGDSIKYRNIPVK
jgi:hypothetical protein